MTNSEEDGWQLSKPSGKQTNATLVWIKELSFWISPEYIVSKSHKTWLSLTGREFKMPMTIYILSEHVAVSPPSAVVTGLKTTLDTEGRGRDKEITAARSWCLCASEPNEKDDYYLPPLDPLFKNHQDPVHSFTDEKQWIGTCRDHSDEMQRWLKLD